MKPARGFSILAASFLLVTLVVALTPAWGQEVTAAITGTVTDPTGAPIPNASVTATDTQRGVNWPTHTNEVGVFFLPRVPIGTYTLKIEAKGFQSATYPAFTLVMNQTARLDVSMKVGQVSETLEVTSTAPLLQTDTTQLSTLIDDKTTVAMPLASRNYIQLILLTPGAVHPNPQSITVANTMTGAGRPYINGNREQANNFILDGMDNNQVGDNEVGYTPSVDAIQEFNLISQNPSAEFGDFQGGIVNTSIKSGTNKFHGSLFEFFRNDVLNANQWANGLQTPVLEKPKLRWNMFGGTIGGAIVKNKLFFFADYQGQRFDHPPAATVSTIVPMAQRSGDFSGLCTAGFNANNICTNPAQTIYNPTTHLPFTHNTIPTSMINAVASKLFASNFYPAPNSGLTQLISNTSSQLNNDQGDLKIDYYLSDKDKMFARWSQMGLRNPNDQSWALAVPVNPNAEEPVKNFVLNWDHNVNTNLLNEARVGFNYVKFGQSFSDHGLGNFAEQIGIANGNVNGPGFPLINFTSVSNIGNAYVLQNFGDSVIQAQDQVIITHNRHLLHAGFGIKRFRVNSAYAGNSGINGQFFFNGQYTATSIPDPIHAGQFIQAGGSDIADFLLGRPSQMQRGGAVGWGQRSTAFSAFLQDDWRVTDSLTVNAGLRYENHTPWVEVNDRQLNFGLFTGDIQFAGKDGNSRALYDAYNFGTDFQPRLGFAWSPKALGGKSVIRGAYSLSNFSEGMGSNNRLPQNVPFVPGEVNDQWGCTTTAGVYSCIMGRTIDQGIPLVPTPTGTVTPASYAGLQIRMWDPQWRPAVTQQYNLSFQQQLTPTTTLQASYVGQHSSHLTNFMWANQMVLQPNGTTVIGPYAAGDWAGKPMPTDPVQLAAFRQTLKGQIGAIRGTFSNGAAKYNAMQVLLQQRTAKGLQAQFSYTLSRCMTDAPGFYGSSWAASQTSVGMPSPQNIYDLAGDWGNCYFDATHLVTGYFVYQLPFGRNHELGGSMSPVADAILGNWELGGILTLRSGMHLEVDSWGDPTATGAFATRPNINGSMTYPKTKITSGVPGIQWFDPTVLSMPSGQFGNLPIGSIVGPPLKTLDLSLHKAFPFGEGKRVEFRAEAINFTNTPILLFGSGATFMDGLPNSNTTGRLTGKITQASGERNVQLALKFYF